MPARWTRWRRGMRKRAGWTRRRNPRNAPPSWFNLALLCQFFGLNAAAFHAESLLLHTANAILVCWLIHELLRRTIGQPVQPGALLICSGVAALLWAVHPLRVEAVAW